MIELKHIQVSYGKREILHDIDAAIGDSIRLSLAVADKKADVISMKGE